MATETSAGQPATSPLAIQLARRLSGMDEATGDWYEALFLVALDETKDAAKALALADEALAKQPKGPTG